jgi:hypothetical protein
MKNLILLLLFIPYLGFSQVNLSVNNLKVKSSIKFKDSTITYIYGDSIPNFKWVRENSGAAGSLNSGLLQWRPDSLSFWSYPNYASAPKGAFYSTTGTESGYDGYNLDTALITSAYNNYALKGSSVNYSGVMGVSTLNFGIYGTGYLGGIRGFSSESNGVQGESTNGSGGTFYSENGIGLRGYTVSGSTNANIGNPSGGDSVTFPKAGGMKVYKGGVKVVEVASDGDLTYKYRHAVGRADSIAYTVGGTQNVFYKINTTAISIKDTVGITIRGDSVYIQKAGDYWIDIAIAVTTSNANDKLRIKTYKNNAPLSPSLGRFMVNSNGTGNMDTRSMRWYVKGLAAGSWLSFRIQNQTAARAVTISDFGFAVSKVPE